MSIWFVVSSISKATVLKYIHWVLNKVIIIIIIIICLPWCKSFALQMYNKISQEGREGKRLTQAADLGILHIVQ